MKKTSLLLILFALCFSYSKAQFNKTIGALSDVGDASVTLSNDGQSIFYVTEYYHDLLVVKTDLNGVMLTNMILPVNAQRPRIISTYDNGVLVAANTFTTSGLFVYKLDNALMQLWNLEIPFASTPSFLYPGYIDVAMIKGEISNNSTYYIGYNAPTFSSYQSAYPQDGAFCVLKIAENGTIIFNNTYADANRLSEPFDLVEDNLNSLAYIPYTNYEQDGQPQIVIGGGRVEVSGFQWLLIPFMMKIDKNGNVISNYRDYTPMDPSSAICYYVMWDNNNKVLAGTYSDQDVVVGSWLIHPAAALMVTDPSLNVIDHRYYYIDPYCMLNPQSISMDNKGNYVLDVDNEYLGNSYYLPNSFRAPSLLKIDPSTLNSVDYRYYPLKDQSIQGKHVHDPITDNHFIVSEYNTTPKIRTRLIRTDNSLNTDCAEKLVMDNIAYMPTFTDYTYTSITDNTAVSVYALFAQTALDDDFCRSSGNPVQRHAEQSAVAMPWSARVFPSLLHAHSGVLYCSVSSPQDATVSITITNMLGQVIYSKDEAVKQGANHVQIDASAFESGLDVVRVTSGDKLLNTTKISIVQ